MQLPRPSPTPSGPASPTSSPLNYPKSRMSPIIFTAEASDRTGSGSLGRAGRGTRERRPIVKQRWQGLSIEGQGSQGPALCRPVPLREEEAPLLDEEARSVADRAGRPCGVIGGRGHLGMGLGHSWEACRIGDRDTRARELAPGFYLLEWNLRWGFWRNGAQDQGAAQRKGS